MQPFTCIYVSAATHMARMQGIFPFNGNLRALRALWAAEGKQQQQVFALPFSPAIRHAPHDMHDGRPARASDSAGGAPGLGGLFKGVHPMMWAHVLTAYVRVIRVRGLNPKTVRGPTTWTITRYGCPNHLGV